MAFYMFQARYAPAAIKAMVESPQDREAPARALLEGLGCKLHQLFFCLGSEDIVAIIEGPDDKTAVAGSMILGASGAFSGGEMTKLLTPADAVEAMTKAKATMSSYTSTTGR